MAHYGQDFTRGRYTRNTSDYDQGFGGGGRGGWTSEHDRDWRTRPGREFGGNDRDSSRPYRGAFGRHDRPSGQYGGGQYGGGPYDSGRYGAGEFGTGEYGGGQFGSSPYRGGPYGGQSGSRRDFDNSWGSAGHGWGRPGFDNAYDAPYGGYSGRQGRDMSDFDRPRRPYRAEGRYQDYDDDFGDKLRRGWNRFREEARDWMGRGYDRGW